MCDVLFPISLDRWHESIPSKFREIVINCQDEMIRFFAGQDSKQESGQELVDKLWSRPNLKSVRPFDLISRRFDIVHNGRATASNLASVISVRLRSRRKTKHIFSVSIEPSPERWNY